jgi:hypothetical protein
MRQRGDGVRLTLEPCQPIRIGGKRGRQHLERDIPTEFGIVRPIDLAHAAGADRRDHLVDAGT